LSVLATFAGDLHVPTRRNEALEFRPKSICSLVWRC